MLIYEEDAKTVCIIHGGYILAGFKTASCCSCGLDNEMPEKVLYSKQFAAIL